MPIASVATRKSTSRLVERHLRVAGARAQPRPSPPRSRPAGAGSVRRWRRPPRPERDHGGAAGQARELGRPGVASSEKRGRVMDSASGTRRGAAAGSSRRPGTASRPRRAHEQAVGEHMPAVGIGAELDLVHRQEPTSRSSGIASTVQDELARARRHDLLFAGDRAPRRARPCAPPSGRSFRAPAGAAGNR